MTTTGIVRKLDGLGRIVLPVEIRRTLDISERDELELFLDDDSIVLRKYEPSCIFCGAGIKLISFRDKNVCEDCISKLKDE